MLFLIFITLLIHLMVPHFIIEIIKCFVDKPKIKHLYWKIIYSFIMLEAIILGIYIMTLVYNDFNDLVWKTKN